VVLAAIVRRQVIDRDAATKLPSAASGLLDGQHHPADIRQRRPRRDGAPRTAAHRSTQATSANIAYAAGEVLQVGPYAVDRSSTTLVWWRNDQRDQPQEPPAGWQRAFRNGCF